VAGHPRRVPRAGLPVIARDRALWDPVLDADLTHIVRDPRIGRLRVTRGYADWAGAADAPRGEDWQPRVAARLASAGTLAAPFVAV
jgi:hypothetical protein